MRYPLFLCMLVSVLFLSSCGKDEPNTNDPENPPGKIELWNKDKIIRFESKSNTSSSSEVYTYDSQGREIAYIFYMNDKISTEYKNYSYNGMVCTYDGYANGVYGYKTTIEFYDESWNRGKIKRSSNEFSGSIPTTRTEYQYDDQDHVIGFKSYNGNTLTLENKNYQYEEDRWSYDMYTSSIFVATPITEYTYNDTETIKRKYTTRTPNSYSEWRYDNEGKEVSCKMYQDGVITSESKNYVYNGKVCTYDVFTNGTKTNTSLIEYY